MSGQIDSGQINSFFFFLFLTFSYNNHKLCRILTFNLNTSVKEYSFKLFTEER